MTVTDEDKALLTLLRAKSTYQTSGGTMAEWINPDGPLAADRIEALTTEVERLREKLAAAYIDLSGHESHTSDCATSNAPAYEPGPCDCKETAETFTRSDNV